MIFRRLTALILCLTLLCSLSASAFAVEFPDVSPEHWAYADIQTAAGLGLIQGLDDGTFRPEERLDRAGFVTILQRMFGWETVTPETPSFTDVSPGDWYYAAVETALANGVVEPGGTFQPAAYVTRQDMAVMICRYAERFGIRLGTDVPPVTFADAGDIAAYALPAVQALQRAGVISGMPDGSFRPRERMTREQACVVLSAL